MRRYAPALALAARTAACSPDLVRAPTDTPASQSADTAAMALGLCGLDYSGRGTRYTLTSHDAWPTATNVALTFAGHTRLSESRKIALLYQAATLADR